MFVMTRNMNAWSASLTGVYYLPPPGPFPPPGAPGPLPNLASFGLLQSASKKVSICGLPACVMPGKISVSTGDELSAGGPKGGGGVLSGTFASACQAVSGSKKLFVDGKQVVRATDGYAHNSNNSMGYVLSPSQTKVMVMS